MSISKILLVDDEFTLVQALGVLVSLQDDMCARIATDGENALNIMDNEHIDVLCTDYQMPGMDGLELIREAHKKDPELPVIIITGAENVKAPAGVPILRKPFNKDALIQMIRGALL